METIIYSKNLADANPNEILQEKFKAIRKSLEEGMKDIVSSVLSNKDKTVIYNTSQNKFSSNPNELKFFKDITDKCQKSYTIDSVFTAFTTTDGKKLIAWGTSSFIIEVYDLITFTPLKTLSGHTQHIYIVRHFFNKKKNTDYLLSTSYERNCKVWDVKTFNCIVTVANCHSGYYLYSALVIYDEKVDISFIVTTAPNEFTKVWDFSGNHCKDIATTTDYTYFINTWNDKNGNIYIINANSTDVKIYDFRTGLLYKFFKSDSSSWHMSAFIADIKDVPHLFETDGNGYLRIWNVNTGIIFKTIHAAGCNLRGIVLWNDEYIVAASSDKSFKVFDMNTNTYTTIAGHDNVICSVEKIELNGYGECLITSAIDGKIKIWKR
jgi:WD40 repeat protein